MCCNISVVICHIPYAPFLPLVEQVPVDYFTLPLSKAEVLKEGADVTIVGYGSQIYTLEWAIEMAEKQMPGLKCELIDLRTIAPWDIETVEKVSAKD